jgi:hypothetical protein
VLLFHLEGLEVKRVRKDLKLNTVIKAKGFEVESDYLKVYKIQHTCELLHPLDQLSDLLLNSG